MVPKRLDDMGKGRCDDRNSPAHVQFRFHKNRGCSRFTSLAKYSLAVVSWSNPCREVRHVPAPRHLAADRTAGNDRVPC